MKVAVYTIALNEEQFVETWFKSAKEADYLLIADTGSTDGTVEKARSLGINVIDVSIKPWRFDDARNAALAVLPKDIDYCIALDMDEVLLPKWKAELRKMLKQNVTRPRYKYTWSWKEDGVPGLQYGGDKIHTRHGYRWKHPVHEVLVADRTTEVQGWCGLEIHHFPDSSKSRGQYHPLLKTAVEEDPSDDRNAYYYARELYFAGLNAEAAQEFRRHLSLPKAVWKPERAASMRYLAKVEPENAHEWLLAATLEDPNRREPHVEQALLFYRENDWENCYASSTAALAIAEKPLDYLCEDFAWGTLPHDLAALSAYHLGLKKEAIDHGLRALSLEPENERLSRNVEFYKGQ